LRRVLLTSLDISSSQFASGTGWEIKPEGACKGDVCVPLDQSSDFDVEGAAERLGMALVAEPAARMWALGPETLAGRALVSAEAPDFTLDDLDDKPFRLSSLRGSKVLLVSWAPY
jgi:hypothetical protein